MNEPTFWFFAYGTEMSASGLTVRIRDALGSSDASSSAVVLESIPAYVQGYRLTLSAVSAEGPRYACANIFPIAKRRPCVEGAEKRQQPLDAYHLPPSADGRLYGVLHQVPEGVRAALMEAISRSGSYNVSALLPCSPADGGEDVSALVVAAMDLELAERTYELSELSSTWKEMDGAATRWPYTHWCRCIATPRVAPSTAYLSALRNAFEECALKLSASTDYMKAYGCVMAAAAADAITPRDVAHDPKEARVWYFAYGSNMSFEQFCVRCGPPYQRRPVRLEEWVLIPNKTPLAHHYASFGYYNIESVAVRENKASTGEVPTEDPNNGMPRYVCGAAYEISLEQLEMMDGYETGYTRELVRCEDIAEELKDAPEEVQKALAASPTVDGSYDCWAYLAIDTNETLLPSKEYVARVLEGSDILPAAYMEAIRAAPKNPLRSPRQDQRLRKEI